MQSWQGFVAWAEAFGISKLSQVKAGPERIRAMAKLPWRKQQIELYLLKVQAKTPKLEAA